MSAADWAVYVALLLMMGAPAWWLLLRLGPEPFAAVVAAWLETVTARLEAAGRVPGACEHLPRSGDLSGFEPVWHGLPYEPAVAWRITAYRCTTCGHVVPLPVT